MENLIFDIGFHRGEDTPFYPSKGCRVIVVDADPDLINEWQNTFRRYIENGELLLLNYVASDTNDIDADFYIGPNTTQGSTKVSISLRMHCKVVKKKIKSKWLDHLFHKYGTPSYCRMNIEGNDIIVLQTMEKVSEKPLYISAKAECIGEDGDIAGHELDALNALYQLECRKSKLVNQKTLTVLDYNYFYKNNFEHNWSKQIETNRKYAEELIILPDTDQRMKFTDFFPGSSGLFGEELTGKWYDYPQTKEILKKHREDKMRLSEPAWTSWCDWYATFQQIQLRIRTTELWKYYK